MASSGGSADYVSTVQGLIFGPTEAYARQLDAWKTTVLAFLDRVYPKGAPTVPAVVDVAQVVNDAILLGAVAAPPVLKDYKGTADLTTDIKQTDDQKIGGSIGGTLSFISASLTYNHETGTQSANTQNYHLEYDVEVPLPDNGDRAAACARLFLMTRQAVAPAAAPAAGGAPA